MGGLAGLEGLTLGPMPVTKPIFARRLARTNESSTTSASAPWDPSTVEIAAPMMPAAANACFNSHTCQTAHLGTLTHGVGNGHEVGMRLGVRLGMRLGMRLGVRSGMRSGVRLGHVLGYLRSIECQHTQPLTVSSVDAPVVAKLNSDPC